MNNTLDKKTKSVIAIYGIILLICIISLSIIPFDKNYTINVDGELYENIPFEIEIVSDKLKVYR
jgi:diacylglycerol kinase family enzyme